MPVEEYLKLQRRFGHLFGDPPRLDVIARIQAIADRNIERFGLVDRRAGGPRLPANEAARAATQRGHGSEETTQGASIAGPEPLRLRTRERARPRAPTTPTARSTRAAVMDKPFAITLDVGSSLANKTGTWRTERPSYVRQLPPCNHACPAGEDIQGWLYHAEEGDYEAAWRVLMDDNPFPAIMGRVCYHPCETACNRAHLDEAVGINSVERFLGDEAISMAGRSSGTRRSQASACSSSAPARRDCPPPTT